MEGKAAADPKGAIGERVVVRKRSGFIEDSVFRRWYNALRKLGAAKTSSSYTYEVWGTDILRFMETSKQPDEDFAEILKAIEEGSEPGAAEALRELYRKVREAYPPDAVSIAITGFYAEVTGSPMAINRIEEAMKRDQYEGGFLIIRKVYDRNLRRMVVKELPVYRRPNGYTLKVPRGSLPRLARILEKVGVKSNIDEITFTSDVDPKRITVPLRDYQVRAVSAALEQIRRFGAATIMAATGSGKTEMGIAVVQALNPTPEQPAVVVVPSKDLAVQWRNRFEQYGLRAGLVTGDTVDIPEGEAMRVLVTTYATPSRALKEMSPLDLERIAPDLKDELADFLKRMREEEEEEREEAEEGGEEAVLEKGKEAVLRALLNAKLVVFDEAHHLPATTVERISRATPRAAKLGLSATPWRNDEKDLIIYANVGEIADRVTSSELIEKGFLVPAYIFMLHTGETGVYSNFNEEKSKVMQSENRVKLAVEVAKMLPPPVLILTQERKPGEKVAQALASEGVKVGFAHGELSTEERERLLNALKNGEITHLVATTLADEGLDIPQLQSLILYFPGKSRTRVFQRIGRALRPTEGKVGAIIVDMVDGTKYLGEHARSRAEMYLTEARWRVFEVKSLEELEQKLREVVKELGGQASAAVAAASAAEEELKRKGWARSQERVSVIAPSPPNLKPPLFSKQWRFGPYIVHGFRSRDTDEAVWIFKREKPRSQVSV